MASVRQAAVAGQFYPGSAAELGVDVDTLLAQAASAEPCPKALVAPHAGYIYSGPVAASVYARLRNARAPIRRVVLLGPSHRVAFRGIATCKATHYATPLGNIPLDRQMIATAEGLPGVARNDAAHAPEHSLEVHLPFLQRTLGEFLLTPLVVGDATPEQVAAVLETLWGGPDTLIVISSDLSHFLSYAEARQQDADTCRQIEARDPTLSGQQACGCRPLNGLLTVLRRRGLGIETVAMNNSGDTAGSRDRVVGYGAWVVQEPPVSKSPGKPDEPGGAEQRPLNRHQQQQLLHLARLALRHRLDSTEPMAFSSEGFDGALLQQRASFVTLNMSGRLRGCIGSLNAHRALLEDVAHNAAAAGFSDPRFRPLTVEEFSSIEIHISVLGIPAALPGMTRQALLQMLEPGVHGLILQEGNRRATFLPSVWEKLPTAEQFVSQLRVKAGLPGRGWSEDTRVSVYTTQEFS